MYTGTVNIAVSAEAYVVSIAIDQYGKDFYVNIERHISYVDKADNVKELTEELRSILATLK